jgi:anion-transporting  ArsA/GET3 family ATPase
LLFVLGKGGVGRSTVAAALGVLAASRGARTIVADLSGRGELPRLLGVTPGARADGEIEVTPGLFTLQITPQQSLEEYLHEQLPLRVLADVLGATRTLTYLAAATPGLRELLCVGKIWELAQPTRIVADTAPYDLVIVDAPASGHSLGLFAAPGTFTSAARGGPIARQAGVIDATLHDTTKTGILAVATPTEAAVNELLETRAALVAEFGLDLGAVVVNAMPPARFEQGDSEILRDMLARNALAPGAPRAAANCALAAEQDRREAARQVARLVDQLPKTPRIEAGQIRTGALGADQIALLSAQLAGVAA